MYPNPIPSEVETINYYEVLVVNSIQLRER